MMMMGRRRRKSSSTIAPVVGMSPFSANLLSELVPYYKDFYCETVCSQGGMFN